MGGGRRRQHLRNQCLSQLGEKRSGLIFRVLPVLDGGCSCKSPKIATHVGYILKRYILKIQAGGNSLDGHVGINKITLDFGNRLPVYQFLR